jgi:hypothetical protein
MRIVAHERWMYQYRVVYTSAKSRRTAGSQYLFTRVLHSGRSPGDNRCLTTVRNPLQQSVDVAPPEQCFA